MPGPPATSEGKMTVKARIWKAKLWFWRVQFWEQVCDISSQRGWGRVYQWAGTHLTDLLESWDAK